MIFKIGECKLYPVPGGVSGTSCLLPGFRATKALKIPLFYLRIEKFNGLIAHIFISSQFEPAHEFGQRGK